MCKIAPRQIPRSLSESDSTRKNSWNAQSQQTINIPISTRKWEESPPPQALTAQDSIQNDKVVCLECGAEMIQLTVRHLSPMGSVRRNTERNMGSQCRTPLAAKSLTKARSKSAKKRGLPEKLQEYIDGQKAE